MLAGCWSPLTVWNGLHCCLAFQECLRSVMRLDELTKGNLEWSSVLLSLFFCFTRSRYYHERKPPLRLTTFVVLFYPRESSTAVTNDWNSRRLRSVEVQMAKQHSKVHIPTSLGNLFTCLWFSRVRTKSVYWLNNLVWHTERPRCRYGSLGKRRKENYYRSLS